MSKSDSKGSGGASVVGMLGVLFVGLKLAGVIDWSWWWVTLPFWGGMALVALMFIVGALMMGAGAALERIGK